MNTATKKPEKLDGRMARELSSTNVWSEISVGLCHDHNVGHNSHKYRLRIQNDPSQ